MTGVQTCALPISNAAQKTFGGEDPQFETETMGDAFVAVFSGITSTAAVPVITAVVNAASLTSALAPGSVASIFGTNLPTSASAGALVGGQTAQVLLASASEWNVIIPYNAVIGASTIQVGTSALFPITLSQYAPALLSVAGNVVAANRVASGAVVSASAPAFPGDTLYIFATGLGAIDSSSHPSPLPTVSVGGQQVTVLDAFVDSTNSGGVYQVTIQLPGTTPAGNLPIILSIGGVSSQSAILPVGAFTEIGRAHV